MKKVLLSAALVVAFFFVFIPKGKTQDTSKTSNMYDLSLEDLMNIEVTVTSKKALTTRETPGIISLITKEEIENSGARDLMEILYRIPGFNFGVDVQGVVSMGVRGIWAEEGKVLLMIDGQEMPELLYGNNEFGNHYSVDQIQRIEIIRGPGSSIYGGNAELCVINIITKSGEDMNGAYGSVTYGRFDNAFARNNYTFGLGKKVKDMDISFHGFIGDANRSGKNYTDLYGNTVSMPGIFTQTTSNFNLGFKYKELSLRFIADLYNVKSKDFYVNAMNDSVISIPQEFNTYLAEIKYNFKLSKKLTITPEINYKNQTPWKTSLAYRNTFAVDSNYRYFFPDASTSQDRTIQRTTGKVICSYDITDSLNLTGGVDGYYDLARANDNVSYFNDKDGNATLKTKDYYNYAGFMQGIYKNNIANLSAGFRFEQHNIYGSSFVPRIGLTKAFSKFHFKLLYSQSFRSPNIVNIELNKNIKPEKATVMEGEIGYKVTDNILAIVNVFDMKITKPILYYIDSVGNEAYINGNSTGSRGAEFDLRFMNKSFLADLTYSFYLAKNNVANYAVPGHDNVVLAFPAHKVTFRTTYKYRNLSFTLSAIYMSERWGVGSVDTLDNPIYKRYKPVLLANCFINYDNFFMKDLSLGIGCNNFLKQDYEFIQPYNSLHGPLPGLDREFFVKLSYKIN